MLSLRTFSLALILSIATNSWAFTVIDERGEVEIKVPESWTYSKNILGLPHVFLSPGAENKTSVSVTLTGIANAELPGKDLKQNQSSYQTGRKDWAQKRNLLITRFHPYEEFKTPEQVTAHMIGLDYKSGDIEQTEVSLYVECPATLVHVKAIGPLGSVHSKEALKFLRTVRCKKVPN